MDCAAYAVMALGAFGALRLVVDILACARRYGCKRQPQWVSWTSPSGIRGTTDMGLGGRASRRRTVGATGRDNGVGASGRDAAPPPLVRCGALRMPRLTAILLVENLDVVVLTTGKHQGQKFIHIYHNHPEYVSWLDAHTASVSDLGLHAFRFYAHLQSSL